MNCELCKELYDTTDRKPYRVCPQQHTVCSQCLPSVKKDGKCPVCQYEYTILNDQVVVDLEVYQKLIHKKAKPGKDQGRGTNNERKHEEFEDKNGLSSSPRKKRSAQEAKMGKKKLSKEPQPKSEGLAQASPNLMTTTNMMRNESNTQNFNQKKEDEQQESHECFCLGEMRRLSDMKFAVFIIVFGAQFVFTLLNLYFPINRPTQDCMDSPYGPNGSTLRSWMLGVGLSEVVLLSLGVLLVLLYKKRCLKELPFTVCGIILLVLQALKIMVWAAVQAYMFKVGMASLCSGGLFAYGVVLMVLHVCLLLIGGVFGLSKIYA